MAEIESLKRLFKLRFKSNSRLAFAHHCREAACRLHNKNQNKSAVYIHHISQLPGRIIHRDIKLVKMLLINSIYY